LVDVIGEKNQSEKKKKGSGSKVSAGFIRVNTKFTHHEREGNG